MNTNAFNVKTVTQVDVAQRSSLDRKPMEFLRPSCMRSEIEAQTVAKSWRQVAGRIDLDRFRVCLQTLPGSRRPNILFHIKAFAL